MVKNELAGHNREGRQRHPAFRSQKKNESPRRRHGSKLSASCEMTPFELFLLVHPRHLDPSSPYGFGQPCQHSASGKPSCGFLLSPSGDYSWLVSFFCGFFLAEAHFPNLPTRGWLLPLFSVCLSSVGPWTGWRFFQSLLEKQSLLSLVKPILRPFWAFFR